MLSILVDILAPVFLIVAVGFVVAKTVGVKPQALAVLAYWVLGPAFMFNVLASTDLEADVVVRVVAASILVMIGAGAVAAIAMRLLGGTVSEMGGAVLTSIHGNVGNFGLAISAFAFGAAALPIAGIVMVTVNTLGILVGVAMATARTASIWRAAQTAFLAPMALAVIPALFVNLGDLTLPVWIDRPISLLAAALIPVMLLTLGVQLSEIPRALPHRLVPVPIVIKLVAAPFIAFGVVALIGLSGVASQVVILQMAMPAAVFTSLIAIEHDLEPDYVTSVVLIGTLVAAATLPVVLSVI